MWLYAVFQCNLSGGFDAQQKIIFGRQPIAFHSHIPPRINVALQILDKLQKFNTN